MGVLDVLKATDYVQFDARHSHVSTAMNEHTHATKNAKRTSAGLLLNKTVDND